MRENCYPFFTYLKTRIGVGIHDIYPHFTIGECNITVIIIE
jgi:hypothetical protein